MDTGVGAPTPLVDTRNYAETDPDRKTTNGATAAKAEFDVRLTVNPVAGAGADNVTTPVSALPATAETALKATEAVVAEPPGSAGGSGYRSPSCTPAARAPCLSAS